MTTRYCRHSPSLQNGKRVAFFPFVHLYPFNIYKNIFRLIPAICKDCTDPGLRLTVWIIKITVKFRDRLLA